MMPKNTKGRQNIEIKKIEDKKSLAVTFSKRRSGLFRKASEFSTLFRAETAFIVFSPTGKPYSYGNPDIGTVIDRYLVSSQFIESHRNPITKQLTKQLADMLGHLDIVQKDGNKIDEIKKASQGSSWWEVPKETLEDKELENMKVAMLGVKKNIERQVERLILEAANPTPTILVYSSTRVDDAGPSN